MDIIEQLQVCGWYQRQPVALRAAIMREGRVITLDAGQTAYLEGDEDTGLWIVLMGELRLHMSAGEDRSALFATAAPGALFGRSRVGGADARIVTAIASDASRALLLSDRAIERIAADQPLMWRALADALHSQLDGMLAALGQMLLLPPRARIAARLLALASATGQISLSQNDVAEMCGLSRKSVNGHLAAMERAGLIERGYMAIRIHNPAGLRRMAGDNG
jgi:CRP-like cAMP-binding protein